LNNFAHMITFFDRSIINDVAVRLGECQHYSDKISEQMLLRNKVDKKNDHLHFFKLLRILNERRDCTVSFYFVEEKEQFYIYSDFFNLEGGFSDAFSFFDDVNSVFMMCENKDKSLYISLIKNGERICEFVANIDNQDYVICNAWQQYYKEIYDTVSGLPSISDIALSIEYILQNSCKSDSQMHDYLIKNALFVDQYII